jgi:hypothetical protein
LDKSDFGAGSPWHFIWRIAGGGREFGPIIHGPVSWTRDLGQPGQLILRTLWASRRMALSWCFGTWEYTVLNVETAKQTTWTTRDVLYRRCHIFPVLMLAVREALGILSSFKHSHQRLIRERMCFSHFNIHFAISAAAASSYQLCRLIPSPHLKIVHTSRPRGPVSQPPRSIHITLPQSRSTLVGYIVSDKGK